MRVTMTKRHCEISDELKSRADKAIEKLVKVANRPQSAEVIFDEDHGAKMVEIVVVLPRGQTKVAKAESNDFRTSLDRAAAKVRSQLQKESRKPSHGVSGE